MILLKTLLELCYFITIQNVESVSHSHSNKLVENKYSFALPNRQYCIRSEEKKTSHQNYSKYAHINKITHFYGYILTPNFRIVVSTRLYSQSVSSNNVHIIVG